VSINDLDKLIEEIIKETTNEFTVVDIFDKESDGNIKINPNKPNQYKLISDTDFKDAVRNFFGIEALPQALTSLGPYKIRTGGKRTEVTGARALAAVKPQKWVLDDKDFAQAFSQKNTQAAVGEILMRTTNVNAYNTLVAIAKKVNPELYTDKHLQNSVINIQKAAAKKAKQDVIDSMKKRNNEFVKSLQTATQQFSSNYDSEELASLKPDEDLNKATMNFINHFLKTDYTETPTYQEFSKVLGYVSSENLVTTVRKLLAADVGFSTQKKQKLLSLLKMASIVDTSTFANLTTDNDKNKLLKRAFKNAKANLPPVEGISLKDPSLKIPDLETDPNIKKSVFSKLSVDNLKIRPQSKNTLSIILNNVFSGFGLLDDPLEEPAKMPPAIIKKEGLIKELKDVIDLNAEDIFGLIKDPNKDPEKIKTALKTSYKFIKDESRFTDEEKKEILDFVSSLVRATDYYASGRQVRTKRGATTGWKVGTAQASGTARIDKEVEDMMRKAGGGDSREGVRDKLINYSKFLDNVNNIVSKDAEFDKSQVKIDTLFSQFVGLEILNDNLFQMEEASVKGTLFEAFLALICGGTQIGSELGGADYVYDVEQNGKRVQVLGSSKLVNSTKFKQAKANLTKPMEYVIAIKYIKTETGELKQAGKDDKIRFVKIYIVYSDMKKAAPAAGNDEDETKAKAYIGKDLENLTIEGRDAGTEVEFDMRTLMKTCYVCDFDFSFLEQTEFSDVSTKIMNKINAQVEKAFSSLTNLRDNITRWVSDKDLIAANQVKNNQQDLTDAIEGMEEDEELKTSKLSESIQQLDKLILEILQESLDK
tara:strand:+ start:37 stop:2496 length:2460 start_codon:yes stop_codon:yes gene_type:complete